MGISNNGAVEMVHDGSNWGKLTTGGGMQTFDIRRWQGGGVNPRAFLGPRRSHAPPSESVK